VERPGRNARFERRPDPPKWFSPEVHLLADGRGLLHAQLVARGEQKSALGEEVILADLGVGVAVILPIGGVATAFLIQAQHRAALGSRHVLLVLSTTVLF